MNLLNVLIEAAEKHPEKAALIAKDRVSSYTQLLHSGRMRGEFLRKKGIRESDAVLVLIPMSIELYEVLIGLWHIGAGPVFFDPSAGNEFIEKCCNMMKPKAMIGIRKAMLLSWFSDAIAAIPLRLSVSAVKTNNISTVQSSVALEGDFPGLVTFTSGSTGMPKGVVRTHEFLQAQYTVLSRTMHYQADDVELGTLPIFALSNLAAGISTVIPNADLKQVGAINADKVISQIRTHGINRLTASPALLDCIAKKCIEKNIKLEGIKQIHTGGGPVFPSLMYRLAKVMPEAALTAVYGSSEAEPIAELKWESLTAADFDTMATGGGLPAGWRLKPYSV